MAAYYNNQALEKSNGEPTPDVQYSGSSPVVMSQPMGAASSTTTVVVQQAPLRMYGMPRQWSSGLCACGEDMGICCMGCWCICCLAGEVTRDMDETCCLPCCVPGALTVLRMKIRTQENIQGSACDDCIKATLCGRCAWCQLAREVRTVKLAREVQLRNLAAQATQGSVFSVSNPMNPDPQ